MLDALYQDGIIALARKSRERPRLEHPDASARVDNPLCGDRVTVDLALKDGRIEQVGHQVRGCALCEAAAEIIAEHAEGLTRTDVEAVRTATKAYLSGPDAAVPWTALSAFEPVRAVKSRHECVLLPFTAVKHAFEKALETGE